MDWATLLSVVTVVVGAVAGSEWISRDRERSKLERDVAIYQQDLPSHARQSLEAAIDARAFLIADRENTEHSRMWAYVLGLVHTWSLALVIYASWRIAHALTALNGLVLVLAAAPPAITLGIYAYRADRRRASYRRRLAERVDPNVSVTGDQSAAVDQTESSSSWVHRGPTTLRMATISRGDAVLGDSTLGRSAHTRCPTA